MQYLNQDDSINWVSCMTSASDSCLRELQSSNWQFMVQPHRSNADSALTIGQVRSPLLLEGMASALARSPVRELTESAQQLQQPHCSDCRFHPTLFRTCIFGLLSIQRASCGTCAIVTPSTLPSRLPPLTSPCGLQTALHNTHVTFDVGNGRVGFAAATCPYTGLVPLKLDVAEDSIVLGDLLAQHRTATKVSGIQVCALPFGGLRPFALWDHVVMCAFLSSHPRFSVGLPCATRYRTYTHTHTRTRARARTTTSRPIRS